MARCATVGRGRPTALRHQFVTPSAFSISHWAGGSASANLSFVAWATRCNAAVDVVLTVAKADLRRAGLQRHRRAGHVAAEDGRSSACMLPRGPETIRRRCAHPDRARQMVPLMSAAEELYALAAMLASGARRVAPQAQESRSSSTCRAQAPTSPLRARSQPRRRRSLARQPDARAPSRCAAHSATAKGRTDPLYAITHQLRPDRRVNTEIGGWCGFYPGWTPPLDLFNGEHRNPDEDVYTGIVRGRQRSLRAAMDAQGKPVAASSRAISPTSCGAKLRPHHELLEGRTAAGSRRLRGGRLQRRRPTSRCCGRWPRPFAKTEPGRSPPPVDPKVRRRPARAPRHHPEGDGQPAHERRGKLTLPAASIRRGRSESRRSWSISCARASAPTCMTSR